MKLASSQPLKAATETWIVTQTAVKDALLDKQRGVAEEQTKIAVEQQGNATVEQKEVGHSPTCLIIDSCLIILPFRLMTIAKVNLGGMRRRKLILSLLMSLVHPRAPASSKCG